MSRSNVAMGNLPNGGTRTVKANGSAVEGKG